MKKPSSIQLNIPHPCTQNWEEMTPCSTGRFCAHCQKTVIDFTTWTDTALYNFFSKNTGEVCGRVLPTQMQRNINIPYQPHSRLYRLTIALGLTLIFAETPQAFSQNRPPKVEQNSTLKKIRSDVNQTGVINGKVTDEQGIPLSNVAVAVYIGGNIKGNATTDTNGNFIFNSLYHENYDIIITTPGFDSCIITNVVPAYNNRYTDIQVVLEHQKNSKPNTRIIGYKIPLRNCDRKTILSDKEIRKMPMGQINYWGPAPGNHTYSREELNRLPINHIPSDLPIPER